MHHRRGVGFDVGVGVHVPSIARLRELRGDHLHPRADVRGQERAERLRTIERLTHQ